MFLATLYTVHKKESKGRNNETEGEFYFQTKTFPTIMSSPMVAINGNET